jgi:hypothetical protein
VDEDNITCHNAGKPTNPNIVIQSTDEEDEADFHPTAKAPRHKKKTAKSEPESGEDETPLQEELDEEELSKS